MTRGGRAYAAPTFSPRTDESASSSLLPTPEAATGGRTVREDAIRRGNTFYRQDGSKIQMGLERTVKELLPTPMARDFKGGNGPNYQREGGDSLPNALKMLPTPRTSDANGKGWHGTGAPDLRTVIGLLPTPRATRGGSATETVRLLPTPTVGDSKTARNSTANRTSIPPTGIHAGDTLTDAMTLIGEPTSPPSNAGSNSPTQPPGQLTIEAD